MATATFDQEVVTAVWPYRHLLDLERLTPA